MTLSGNYFLTLEQMTVNAQYILDYLLTKGWSRTAICGALGNMQTESTINPGVWQNLDDGNMLGGYGLVQWTPATKYTEWADVRGLVWGEMNSNLARLEYEVDNNIQWMHSSMSFYQYTQSNLSAYELGVLFLLHYERPAVQDEYVKNLRGSNAYYWDYVLSNGNNPNQPNQPGGYLPPSNATNTNKHITMLLTDAVNGWKW